MSDRPRFFVDAMADPVHRTWLAGLGSARVAAGVVAHAMLETWSPIRRHDVAADPDVVDGVDEEPARELGFAPDKTWITIRLVDTAGAPVSGVELTVLAPDGTYHPRATDASGAVTIEGIEKGACSVSCDIVRATLPTTWAIAREARAAAPSGGSPSAAARSGRRFVAVVEERHVATGESLASIAASANLSWRRLAEFNWGTSVPDEINAHLRDDVGCTERARDGVNWSFRDSDHPGIVYVPRPWEEAGLATTQEHEFRVRAIERFLVRLENEQGLRIPDAAYEITFADGSQAKRKLGRGGVDAIESPPPGPVEIEYTDLDDVNAKSLAATLHDALERRRPQDVLRGLKHDKGTLTAAIAAYDAYFDDRSGRGLLADIDDEVTDPEARSAVTTLLLVAGLPVKERAVLEEPGDDGAAAEARELKADAPDDGEEMTLA